LQVNAHAATLPFSQPIVSVYNYDALTRLYRQQTDLSVSRQLDFTFDQHGNLTSKLSNVTTDLDVTGYTYATSLKPHRLTSVNIGGNVNTLSYSSAGDITQYDATAGNDTWLEYDGQHNVTDQSAAVLFSRR